MKRSPMKRGTSTLARTPFKAKSDIGKPISSRRPDVGIPITERVKPVAVPLTRPVRYAEPANEPMFSAPKEVKAKPGKGAPNAEERAWMDAIVEYGCIACRLDGLGVTPPAVHHILRGGQRIGHLFTIPLCDPGHHQGGQPRGMVSRHPWKTRFEERYGTELELLERLRVELAKPSP